MSGTKFDAGKPRMDLLDPLALEGLAKVLTFGANKYAPHNWRGGLVYSRLVAALLRHIFAILRGEQTDPESGLPHIDHAGCCWMFLSNMMKTRPDMDDLFKDNKNVSNLDSSDSTGPINRDAGLPLVLEPKVDWGIERDHADRIPRVSNVVCEPSLRRYGNNDDGSTSDAWNPLNDWMKLGKRN